MACKVLAYVFVPSFKIMVKQALWEFFEPSGYYMEVTELRPDGGPWRWAVRVRNGRLVSIQALEVDTRGRSNSTNWLDPDTLTVEQIFAIADRFCVDRGFLNCGLEFDPRFHYLKRIESYEMIIVEINQFVPCEETENCFPCQ
jgi:hypothetical protein